jgi:CpeT/CpcT family (DUF1001)
MAERTFTTGSRLGWLAVLLLPACVALAAGCTGEGNRKQQAGLDAVSEMLPGRYDNQAQIAEDQRSGRVPHEALTLSVLPINADTIGVHMFYVQEMASGTREVRLQRLLSVGLIEGKIVATQWAFTDPQRWREGDSTPEIFTSLQPPDVRALRGCNLTFKKDGAQFTGSTELGKCNPGVSHTGVLQSLEMRVELTADELALSTRFVDPQGHALSGRDQDPYIRFRRSGGS